MHSQLFGCTIYFAVASLLPHFQPPEKKYKDKMHPTDHHYLFNIANDMQFPAARCAQGNSVCMYSKSASSGVESMTRANEVICQRTAVDILNAALILLK
jgi:hypothetical protein